MSRSERYMKMDLAELAEWCGMHAQPESPAAGVAQAVLTARLAGEAARVGGDAARATASTATATWRLVFATWGLMAATWVLVLATVLEG